MPARHTSLFTVLATADGLTYNDPKQRQKALLQTWNAALDGTNAKGKGKNTPVTRVVGLLEDMKATLGKEMQEDEDLYDKMTCWCNSGKYEKNAAITASQEKIEELENSIESYTAKSAELKTRIAELEAGVAADKKALKEASELRAKQLQEFQGKETDSIQAIENLKAALVVLAKHHGGAFLSQLKPDVSFAQVEKDEPNWNEKSLEHRMDDFLLSNGYDGTGTPNSAAASQGFLQNQGQQATTVQDDVAVVQRALRSAKAFVQAQHEQEYYPSYHAQSGEIVGILKQLKEEMEATLSEEQKTEQMRAAAFAELRAAKTSEIEEGEKMAEQKEDELAATDNANAEAKEDLQAEKAALSESQIFLKNLDDTCANADANFAKRKASRLEEIKAVSETIEILTADEARDAMSGTYSFLQMTSDSNDHGRKHAAATVLRHAAAKSGSPELSALATSVELDAFTKVKKAIDGMIANLQQQQSDEVKKNDWCKASLQENEMTTAKTETAKQDLQAKIELHSSNIVTLEKEIMAAGDSIKELHMNLQRASEDRKAENNDFQTTVADQTATIEVLHKALDRLATYYDAELIQTKQKQKKQTPPVPEMEYKPNAGATGVMSMIEKLIYEAKDLVAKSKTSENAAQAAYETLVADTNANVEALANEITAKTKTKAKTTKAKLTAESDLMDTVDELEGLYGENSDLHAECDYLLKNFDLRQTGRSQEIEALQQAKEILSGANLS